MERDYGLLSRFVEEDEKRKKEQDPEEMDRESRVEALKKLIQSFSLPKDLELNPEGDDAFRFQEGFRERKRQREPLKQYLPE